MTDRKEKLLAAARERLRAKERKAKDEQVGSSAGRPMMYRGQVVRSSGGSASDGDAATAEVRAELAKLKQLYHDGLITRSEAENKRAELLKRFDL